MQIPKDFLLGAATSAHQVEGENINNDWWYWEQKGKLPESGVACDHYHKYQEDFALAKSVGLNAQRIGIEWARVEPEPGIMDRGEINHYRNVLKELRKQGFAIMVTLHHFTLPRWASEEGGFLSNRVRIAFADFAGMMVAEFDDLVDWWITINEPEVYTAMGYGKGVWPPFKKGLWFMYRVQRALVKAHKLAFSKIKNQNPKAQVGIAKNNAAYYPARMGNPFDQLLVWCVKAIRNHTFLKAIVKYQDFIGLNFYFTHWLSFPFGGFDIKTTRKPHSDMGWFIYPQGLKDVLLELKQYNCPIYVTENGLADTADNYRGDYLRDHLGAVFAAKELGADVRGYFYWSLLDNYEWHEGFGPRFGLIAVDYPTQTRTLRESAKIFKELI